jgi:SAM-dependent methyltransferase
VPCWVRDRAGTAVTVPVHSWLRHADRSDDVLLDACSGPALGVGCGPGRLTVELSRRGVPALGVDVSAEAVRLTRERGGAALWRDVFAALPGEGRWACVLLADGNIGIGGHPVQLLRRAAGLVAADGRIVVEVEPPGVGLQRSLLRLESGASPSGWFRWARVDMAAVGGVAAAAGLRLAGLVERSGRVVAQLRPAAASGS